MLSILLSMALATGMKAAAEQPDVTAATSWVHLIDAARWDDSWTAAGTLFKSQMPQPRWASTIGPVREQLGTPTSRVVKGVTRSKSLPGAPVGDYEVVQFETSFANKVGAIETVVLAREPSGWKVDGYFIK